ncbi:MAG: hypothetical protein ACK55Z_10705, partial [bacterium]
MKYIRIDDEEMIRRQKTVQKEFPIHVSKVALIDPETQKATRIRSGLLEDGTKVRVAVKSGAIIPKPDRSSLKY